MKENKIQDKKKPAQVTPAGAKILGALNEFRDALNEGGKLEDQFTVRTVELDLHATTYQASDVKDARRILGLSQPLFAKFLGVNLSTVRSWEHGINTPSPLATRFLDEIRTSPRHWKARLKQMITDKNPGRPTNQD